MKIRNIDKDTVEIITDIDELKDVGVDINNLNMNTGGDFVSDLLFNRLNIDRQVVPTGDNTGLGIQITMNADQVIFLIRSVQLPDDKADKIKAAQELIDNIMEQNLESLNKNPILEVNNQSDLKFTDDFHFTADEETNSKKDSDKPQSQFQKFVSQKRETPKNPERAKRIREQVKEQLQKKRLEHPDTKQPISARKFFQVDSFTVLLDVLNRTGKKTINLFSDLVQMGNGELWFSISKDDKKDFELLDALLSEYLVETDIKKIAQGHGVPKPLLTSTAFEYLMNK